MLCEKAGDLGRIADDEAYNRAAMAIIKAVNPVNYTAHGPFDHDAAVPAKPFPGLQGAARLPRLPAREMRTASCARGWFASAIA